MTACTGHVTCGTTIQSQLEMKVATRSTAEPKSASFSSPEHHCQISKRTVDAKSASIPSAHWC
eukprot:scaffold2637_cov421-Pavlova_lutheri.AAC.9